MADMLKNLRAFAQGKINESALGADTQDYDFENDTEFMQECMAACMPTMIQMALMDEAAETMDENTVVSMDFDKELLYKNMVAAKAEWLYTLPQWDELLDADTRKALYKEQKLSTTVVNTQPKVGRNDPCPCGSGKKYKKCCGANV